MYCVFIIVNLSVLLYEPNNMEAAKFLPLIQERICLGMAVLLFPTIVYMHVYIYVYGSRPLVVVQSLCFGSRLLSSGSY